MTMFTLARKTPIGRNNVDIEASLLIATNRNGQIQASVLAGAEGIEPPTSGFGDQRSAN